MFERLSQGLNDPSADGVTETVPAIVALGDAVRVAIDIVGFVVDDRQTVDVFEVKEERVDDTVTETLNDVAGDSEDDDDCDGDDEVDVLTDIFVLTVLVTVRTPERLAICVEVIVDEAV